MITHAEVMLGAYHAGRGRPGGGGHVTFTAVASKAGNARELHNIVRVLEYASRVNTTRTTTCFHEANITSWGKDEGQRVRLGRVVTTC